MRRLTDKALETILPPITAALALLALLLLLPGSLFA